MKFTPILFIISALLLFSCGKKTEKTTVLRKDITEMLFASGTLEASDEYHLTAQSEGYILKLNFDEGDLVAAEQVFAIIENKKNVANAEGTELLLGIARQNSRPSAPQLIQAETNIETAKLKLEQDQKQERRYKELLVSNSISKLEYETMKLALDNSRANLKVLEEKYENILLLSKQQVVISKQQFEVSSVNKEHNKIKIIVPGKVLSVKKKMGDFVRKGDIIASIGNPDKTYAYLSIDESNMGKIVLGQDVFIQLNTNQAKIYNAYIAEIKPVFDEQAQSFFLKAFFKDSLDFRLPGTQLEANIKVAKKENVLVIPSEYLNYGNKVMLEDNSSIDVLLGIVSNDWIEVREGLKEGQIVKRELDK